MASFNEITPSRLFRLLGASDTPVIIDVRLDEDYQSDRSVIPTAKRCDYRQIDRIAEFCVGRKAIVVCHAGKKISQGVAARLRCRGIAAEVLAGGHTAWCQAGLPTIKAASLSLADGSERRMWVTRHRPKIDRLACPWLIRRFVDPEAEFLFVAPSQVFAVAERFAAEPFDVEGVSLSHRGDLCTFDVMLLEFGLSTDALNRMAEVIRAADTDRLADVPEAAGLLAVSLGLSRLYRDDLQQLDAAMTVYDAFYRWARDAFDETHTWPAAK